MSLNIIESDFLSRLSLESWTSPPVFDHSLLERMVRAEYVTTQATGHGVLYQITDLGRAKILKANLARPTLPGLGRKRESTEQPGAGSPI